MAARGGNKVILVGQLGQDPDVRYMPNGGAVASLTLATSETWRDKQTGEMRENTEWHRVVMFGKLAEVAGEYLRKGAQVYIEGQMRTRSWQDDTGATRYVTEVLVGQSLRAPRRSSPRSRRVQPLRHNLLTLRLNPRKRRAVKKAVRAPPRLSFLLSRSRMITR